MQYRKLGRTGVKASAMCLWWNAAAGSWDFYLVDMVFGTDFNVEFGEGHVLKSTIASTWTIPSS